MGKRAQYWAVFWGGYDSIRRWYSSTGTIGSESKDFDVTIRYAGPCDDTYQARKEAYGMVSNTMTAVPLPGNPKYMSAKSKQEFHKKNIDFHNKRMIKLVLKEAAEIFPDRVPKPDPPEPAPVPVDRNTETSEYEWI